MIVERTENNISFVAVSSIDSLLYCHGPLLSHSIPPPPTLHSLSWEESLIPTPLKVGSATDKWIHEKNNLNKATQTTRELHGDVAKFGGEDEPGWKKKDFFRLFYFSLFSVLFNRERWLNQYLGCTSEPRVRE